MKRRMKTFYRSRHQKDVSYPMDEEIFGVGQLSMMTEEITENWSTKRAMQSINRGNRFKLNFR
jgi:hypothetical protein